MIDVKVIISGKDRYVGAMGKALAVEVAGHRAVGGTKKEFLAERGYYLFHFLNDGRIKTFHEVVEKYIPANLAQIPPSIPIP